MTLLQQSEILQYCTVYDSNTLTVESTGQNLLKTITQDISVTTVSTYGQVIIAE